jgi:FAD/FMN-containing dehydrogenase
MTFTSLDGGRTDVPPDDIDALRLRLRGQVLDSTDPGFEAARTIWNGMIDRRPALVVRALGASDVSTVVGFAREKGVLLSIRAGGHNIAGLAIANGALQLDLGLMRGVFVDPMRRVARAQGGCLLGDIDRETQLHGLVTPLGFVSATGAAGLTLGGGLGYLSRRFGWTSDNVTGFEVVTAEGRVVRAAADENQDLFWGLRGGGGNFGVVTAIDYALYDLRTDVVGGVVAWPAEDAPHVLEMFRDMSAVAPRELTLVSMMRMAPPAPWLPTDLHGKPIIAIAACHSGPPDEGERAVAPIKSFRSPVGDILVRRPYVQLQSLLDATQPNGRRYYWKSEYLPGVSADLCEIYMARAASIPSPHTGLILFQIGGALNDLPDDHSPAGNRDARFLLSVGGSWDRADDDALNMDWVRSTWESLRPFSTGGNYINFLNEDDGEDRFEAALGGAMDRLREVKARWDPGNLFRTNRNILPAA